MESTNVLTDPVRLFDLAGATAKALAEEYGELRSEEARLRAAIAQVSFTRACHLAMVDAAQHSPKARCFVEAARRKHIRAERNLKLCLAPLIAPESELVKNEDLLNVAGFALSIMP